MKINEEKIRKHIEANMDNWLFGGHVAECHINATENELKGRLGKYEHGKLITRSSTFVDDTYGDDIVQGLTETLKGRSAKILRWLCDSSEPLLLLHFSVYPKGVAGVTCTISDENVVPADGYSIILDKSEQAPFYLLNAYPVCTH